MQLSPGGAGTAVAGAVAGAAGHAVASVVGAGFSAVFDAAGSWVASGAVWLLGEVGQALSASTTIDLTSGWFSAHLSVMAALSAALVLPMICCAVIQALYQQNSGMLIRTFLVQLPLALLLTGVAVELVQMALVVTDTLSSQVLASGGVDTTNILAPVTRFLVGSGALVEPGVPAFVVFIGGLLVAVATLVLWLELVVRAAAVYVATLFLPLALAALVWPAVSHWCRRLADTLAALILSKLVIAAVLSLAAGALAGGLGLGTEHRRRIRRRRHRHRPARDRHRLPLHPAASHPRHRGRSDVAPRVVAPPLGVHGQGTSAGPGLRRRYRPVGQRRRRRRIGRCRCGGVGRRRRNRSYVVFSSELIASTRR